MHQQELNLTPPYDIENANILLIYEDTISPASGAEVQGFVVEDYKVHEFLQDVYHNATPSKRIIELREQFNKDFAAYHRSDCAYTRYSDTDRRFLIETVTF